MNKFIAPIILSVCLITGILYYCIAHEIIFFYISSPYVKSKHTIAEKKSKNIVLIYWHNQRWYKESDTIVWSTDLDETIKTILNRWIDILHEEQMLPSNLHIQSIAFSDDMNHAYISFSSNPFMYNNPTIEHLLWIKGMLRTLYENEIPLQTITILVNHSLIDHMHLDFSHPWPLHCLDHINPKY